MPEPYAGTLATVATGRTALVARLRTIAARVEELPLDAAAEVLVLLEPAMAALEQDAARALERAPAGQYFGGGTRLAVHRACGWARTTRRADGLLRFHRLPPPAHVEIARWWPLSPAGSGACWRADASASTTMPPTRWRPDALVD
jgi:hypothetical protein